MIALDPSLNPAMRDLLATIDDARRAVTEISRAKDMPTAKALCDYAMHAENVFRLEIKYLAQAEAQELLIKANATLIDATARARAGTLTEKPADPHGETLPAETVAPEEDEWIIGKEARARFHFSEVTQAKWIKDGTVRTKKGPGKYSKLLSLRDLEIAVASLHRRTPKLQLVERPPESMPTSAMGSPAPQLVEHEKINVFRERMTEFAAHDPKPEHAPTNVWIAWEAMETPAEGGVA
jgi:hypothetical protein